MDRDTSWISSAQYVEMEGENVSITVTKTSGGTCSVPISMGNRHYKDILSWVSDGNTIADAE
jgi:hypothetical protein